MSEYIMEYLPDTTSIEREKIVRCRDCVKFCNGDAYYCTDDWCQEFSCQIEPDGFCAWGEHK